LNLTRLSMKNDNKKDFIMTGTEAGLVTAVISLLTGCGGIFIGLKGKLTQENHDAHCPVNKTFLDKERHDELCDEKLSSVHKSMTNLGIMQGKMFKVLDVQATNIAILLDRSKSREDRDG